MGKSDILKEIIKEKSKVTEHLVEATPPNKELVLKVSEKLQRSFDETLEENVARRAAVSVDKLFNLCHAPINFGPLTTVYLSSGSCALIIAVTVVSLINLRHFHVLPLKIGRNQNLNFVINGVNFMLISAVVTLGARGTNLVVQQLLGNLPPNFCTHKIDSTLLHTRKLCYAFVMKYGFHSELVVYHLKTYDKLFGSLYDYQCNPSFVEKFLFDHETTYLKPLDPIYSNDSIDLVPNYQGLKGGLICLPFNKKIKIRNVAGILICVLPLPRVVKDGFVITLFLEKILLIKNQRKVNI
jgi:hypothetical protein